MKPSLPRRYDTVGSFLRSKPLKLARHNFYKGDITIDELIKTENSEIEKLIFKQINHGLRNITDGEFRRSWWHLDIFWGFKGINKEFSENFQKKLINGTPRLDSISIHSKISGENHPIIKDFLFTNNIVQSSRVEGVIARQTLPSPSRFFYQLISNKKILESVKCIYSRKNELIEDIVKAYQLVVSDLLEAGCQNIQFDDTTWITLVDKKRFKDIFEFYDGNLDDLKIKLAEDYIELNNRVIQKFSDDILFSTHTCRGNFKSQWMSEGAYDDVANYIFNDQEFEVYFLEYDSERAGSFEALKKVPNNKKIVLGLITTKKAELENEDYIIKRIENASHFHPIENLYISPQCGFASTEEGNRLNEEDQWKKIELLRSISDKVW